MQNIVVLIVFFILSGNLNIFAQEFEVAGIKYRITSPTEYTLEVIPHNNPYAGDIVIPEQVIYEDSSYIVTSIGNGAFSTANNLTSIQLPNSLLIISDGAFLQCRNLTTIKIPNSVTSIGVSAFLGCRNMKSIILGSGLINIGNHAFNNCVLLDSIIFPNSLSRIGEGAFRNCNSLKSIELPVNITNIQTNTFRDCRNLSSIIFPKFINTISDGAFMQCTSLISIVLPGTVLNIGQGAFSECYSLESLTVLSLSPPRLGANVFEETSKNIPLYVPFRSVSLYKEANQWKDFYTIGINPSIGSGDILVSGHVFIDKNENGAQNENEWGLPQQKLLILPDSIFTFTDDNGDFFFRCGAGRYHVEILLEDNWELTSSQSTFDIVVSNIDLNGFDFGVKPKINNAQLEAYLTSLESSPCSEPTTFYITFRNLGTSTSDGQLTFFPDKKIRQIISTSPEYDSASSDTSSILWNFKDLKPQEERRIHLNIRMPDRDNLGDTLYNIVTISPTNFGNTYSDTAHLVVRCDFNPNNKFVLPTGVQDSNYVLVQEALTYTIKFQNTGNDTVHQVVILDTLSRYLDLNTFDVLTSSHPVKTTYTSDGVAEFRFDNINLVDSITNEPLSHGFVKYRIKAKEDLPDFTVIENKASIYIDFSPPSITNTTQNTLTYLIPGSTSVFSLSSPKDIKIKLYPNPFNTTAYLEFDNTFSDPHLLYIIDRTGHILQVFHSDSNVIRLEKGQMNTGLYFYKLQSIKTKVSYCGKFIVE